MTNPPMEIKEIKIREATYSLSPISPENVAEMEKLDSKCFDPEIAFTGGYFRLLFHYDQAFGWGLKQDGKLIAFILLTPHRQRINIATIDVNSGFRRRGLGKALVNLAEEEVARKGFISIFLQVHTDNKAAINLYENSGYSIIRTIPDYYPTGDAYLMRKPLKQAN